MRFKKLAALLLAAAITVTGMYIPVNPVNAYATEVELTDTTEASTTGDTYAYVRSARELISALNGKSVSGSSVKIEMKQPYSLSKDDNYTIVNGDVDVNTGIVLPENTDITVDMGGNNLGISDNVVQNSNSYLKLVVPKSATLTITSTAQACIPFEIENKGTLKIDGRIIIIPSYGNGILNTGEAAIEGDSGINFDLIQEKNENRAPIYNEGGTFVISTDKEIYTNSSTYTKNSSIINKDGNVTIENANIGGLSSSGNAIVNEGSKATLEIRGGAGNGAVVEAHTDNAIVNNGGKVTLQEGTRVGGDTYPTRINIRGAKVGILNYNGGSLDMYSGTVYGGDHDNCAAISTTPYIDSSLTGTTSGGSVKILGGEVGNFGVDNIGIAYAGSEVPVIMGGDVHGVKGAVVKYASNGQGTMGVLEPVTTYQFRNKKNQIVDAYKPASGGFPASALQDIWDGLNSYASQTVSFDGIKVKTFQELQQAVVSGGSIQIIDNIELTQDLVFEKDATLYSDGNILIINDPNMQVKINEKVNVRFAGEPGYGFMMVEALSANEAGIINHGTLSMNQISIVGTDTISTAGKLIQNTSTGTINIVDSSINICHPGLSPDEPSMALYNAEGGKAYLSGRTRMGDIGADYGVVIYNEGSLWLDTINNGIYTNSNAGVAILNKGTAEMKGKTGIISGKKNSIAVKNLGSFIMRNGTVTAYRKSSAIDHSYAILYSGTSVPQLIGGTVVGAYYGESFTPSSSSKGAAVSRVTDWSTLATEMGSFKDEAGVETSGKNSSLILNGIPRVDATLYSQYDYLLMEKGEVITDCPSKLFGEQYKYSISNNFSMTSNSANVVSVSKNAAGEWVASAVGTGMSMLRLELKEAGISDYIRVEVVEDREKLSSESYQGSVMGGDVIYSAYRSFQEVPIEWHLKDSYDITSGGSELDFSDLKGKPLGIQLDSQDPNFEKYFSYDMDLNYDKTSKECSISLFARSKNAQEYNYLVNDEIKEISNIEAKLIMDINDKTEIVSLGTFDIIIDSTKPKFEYRQITLNSAYTAETCYDTLEYDDVCPNYAILEKYSNGNSYYITKMACPNGFSNKPLVTDVDVISAISYRGAPKTGSYSIPATACSAIYNGSFETKIPVKVINEKPKADVTTRNIVVAKTTADSSDIPMLVSGKTEASVATVSKVEILEKNSSFVIANSVLYGINNTAVAGKGYVHNVQGNASFYLQQRKALTKAEKVTLKFTYQGARGSSKATQIGSTEPCDYTSTTTVTIVPKELAQASMKQTNKPVLIAKAKTKENKTIAYDYTSLQFTTTPSNYEGGHFLVSSLNGKQLTGLDVGKVEKVSDGKYAVQVYANSTSKPGKTKFALYWFDKDGKQIGKPLKASVIFQADSQLKITTSKAEMDINRERTFDKAGYETTYDGVGAEIKYTSTSDWYMPVSLNPNFYIPAKNVTKAILKPEEESLRTGALLPGKTYSVDLKFYNTYGDSRIQTVQVKIKDIPNIKVQVADTSIYKNAPYQQSILDIYTSKPAYGIYVTKVEITDANTPFETKPIRITGDEYMNQNTEFGQQARWSIAFKDNQYNSKMIGKQKVNLKLTYQDGSTANVKTNVYIIQ